MALNWLNSQAAKEFGASLAHFYLERIPPDASMTQKAFAASTLKVLRQMELQILQFKANNPLNVYKTAQLGNAFKWALKDAGYDAAYIDRLTDWLVTKI